MAGLLYGEKGTLIGMVTSRFCNYDDDKHQLLMVYGLSALDDDGRQTISECVFSGILFPGTGTLIVRGHWYHLSGEPISGTAEFSMPAQDA